MPVNWQDINKSEKDKRKRVVILLFIVVVILLNIALYFISKA